MAKLGFLGLGLMGRPMAARLVEAGHEVAVWSHTEAKAQQFATSMNSRFCETPADVARGSECVFVCVGDTRMSRRTILEENGIAEGGSPGLTVIDCSTISPAESCRIGDELSKYEMGFLDAPCTGSTGGAKSGTLTFMVGGVEALFERVRPCFEPMGKSFYYCGPQGAGLRAKLTQNLILGNLLQAFNEGFVLSAKAGIDPDLMLDILNNSAARSGLIAAKAPAVFRRDFSTNFSVKWLEKDMGLMVDLARELGVPVPLTALSQQLLRTAIAKGFGDEDICGSIRVLEEIAQCEVGQKSIATTAN